MIDFDDPRLILCDFAPKQGHICRTCQGSTWVFDEEGPYLLVCDGPCKGTGYTDLPLPEEYP